MEHVDVKDECNSLGLEPWTLDSFWIHEYFFFQAVHPFSKNSNYPFVSFRVIFQKLRSFDDHIRWWRALLAPAEFLQAFGEDCPTSRPADSFEALQFLGGPWAQCAAGTLGTTLRKKHPWPTRLKLVLWCFCVYLIRCETYEPPLDPAIKHVVFW